VFDTHNPSSPRSSLTFAAAGVLMAGLMLAGTASTQGHQFANKRLIGWADPMVSSSVSTMDMQELVGCPPAFTICKYGAANSKLQPAPTRYYSGGSAYDARHRVVWNSDGAILEDSVIRGCTTRCGPMPATLVSGNAQVSGLAISQGKPRLFQLATYEYYFEIVTYDLQQCPNPIAKCTYNFSTTGPLVRPVATGLAYSQRHDLLYIGISSRNTTTGKWEHTCFVSPASSPCKPICSFKLFPASDELLTGLAWDNCARILYATDGQLTQGHGFSGTNHCTPKYALPCKKQLNSVWHGLCLVPGDKDVRVGKSCTTAPCPSCPSMLASTYGGDPVLGNASFGFSLSQAPSNGIGVLLLRYGPLGPGFPFLCDRLYATTGPLILLSAVPMGGSGSCGGFANVNFPIPSSPGLASVLCGAPLSSQWIVFCRTSVGIALGGVSNALQFKVVN
jgi:hypothetical protein